MPLLKRNRKYRNLIHPHKPGTFDVVLELEDIYSNQYFSPFGTNMVPVLSGVNLTIKKGEIWAVATRLNLTASLLMAIIANTAYYDCGHARIMGQDMPRRKRIMLRDVFYIGTTEMLYEDMNVLEFISFATQHSDHLEELNAAESQRTIFDFLIAADLGYISLSKISNLSLEEKTLVLMVVAYYSNNSLIVLGIQDLKIEMASIESFAYIVNAYRESNQSFIFPSVNNDHIVDYATHVSVLSRGRTVFNGSVEELKEKYDTIAFTIQARHPKFASEMLRQSLPDYNVSLHNDKIFLRNIHSNDVPSDMEVQYLYAQIREAELWVEQVHVNKKEVGNAIKEAMHTHDLSL